MAETRLYRRRAVRSSGVVAVLGYSGTTTARSVKKGSPTGNPAGSSIASRERRGHSTRYTACAGSDGRADGRRLHRRNAAQTACFGRFRMLVGVAPKTTAGWCCPTSAKQKKNKKMLLRPKIEELIYAPSVQGTACFVSGVSGRRVVLVLSTVGP